MRFKILLGLCLFSFLFSFFSVCFGAEEALYVWSNSAEKVQNKTVSTNANVSEPTTMLTLDCASAILMEQTTGQILYASNEHEKLAPASVTKLMSILLILEALEKGSISLDTQIPCSENAASMGGSQIWLDPRETLSVDHMLKAICVVSANDCTVAMAEYVAGSEEAFVQKMNERAKELGMKDTTYKNCHGIDEDGHVTSSYDLAILSCYLLNHYPEITKYTTIWMDTLRDGKSSLVNTNKLIRNYQGATGLKTGSTSIAGYNLSASATRGELSLVAVILKAPSTKVRFSEAEKLLNYGFHTYEFKSLGKENNTVATLPVDKGMEPVVEISLKKDVGLLLQKGQTGEVSQNVFLPEHIPAPIKQGEKVGEVVYTLEGKEIARTDLVAKKEVEKNTWQNLCSSVFRSWCSLLRT